MNELKEIYIMRRRDLQTLLV